MCKNLIAGIGIFCLPIRVRNELAGIGVIPRVVSFISVVGNKLVVVHHKIRLPHRILLLIGIGSRKSITVIGLPTTGRNDVHKSPLLAIAIITCI